MALKHPRNDCLAHALRLCGFPIAAVGGPLWALADGMPMLEPYGAALRYTVCDFAAWPGSLGAGYYMTFADEHVRALFVQRDGQAFVADDDGWVAEQSPPTPQAVYAVVQGDAALEARQDYEDYIRVRKDLRRTTRRIEVMRAIMRKRGAETFERVQPALERVEKHLWELLGRNDPLANQHVDFCGSMRPSGQWRIPLVPPPGHVAGVDLDSTHSTGADSASAGAGEVAEALVSAECPMSRSDTATIMDIPTSSNEEAALRPQLSRDVPLDMRRSQMTAWMCSATAGQA